MNLPDPVELVEGELDGFEEIAGVPRDGGGVSAAMHQKPGEDFRPCVHPEEGAQEKDQVSGHAGVLSLAHAAMLRGTAQEAGGQKSGIGIAENRQVAAFGGEKQRFGIGIRRRGTAEPLPFPKDGLFGRESCPVGFMLEGLVILSL